MKVIQNQLLISLKSKMAHRNSPQKGGRAATLVEAAPADWEVLSINQQSPL